MIIALLGGTGNEGRGLALRWAQAGHHIIVGSRAANRASAVADIVAQAVGGHVEGTTNEDAAAACELAVVTVPFAAQAALLETVRSQLAGKIVVSTVVPVDFSATHPFVPPEEGSAAEQAQALLPPDTRVVAAFHLVAAHDLEHLERKIDCDALIAGNDRNAKAVVAELAKNLGVRPVDVGGLPQASVLEAMTTLLIRVNRIHRSKSAGIRITGIEPA